MPKIVSPEDRCYMRGRFCRELLPQACESAREEICEVDASTVIVLVGLPGSGKSTWAQNYTGPLPVYDACNCTPWERKRLLRMLDDAGKEARAVYFNTPVSLCVQRDAQRSPDRVVGEAVICKKAHSMRPPTTAEGFTRVEMAKGW